MNDYQKCVLTAKARRDRSVILMIYLSFFQAFFLKEAGCSANNPSNSHTF